MLKNTFLIDFSIAEQAVKDNFDIIGNLDTFFRNLFILTGKTLQRRKGLIISWIKNRCVIGYV